MTFPHPYIALMREREEDWRSDAIDTAACVDQALAKWQRADELDEQSKAYGVRHEQRAEESMRQRQWLRLAVEQLQSVKYDRAWAISVVVLLAERIVTLERIVSESGYEAAGHAASDGIEVLLERTIELLKRWGPSAGCSPTPEQ